VNGQLKSQVNEVYEIKQSQKDSELIYKNIRHQIEQLQQANSFKAQEYHSLSNE